MKRLSHLLFWGVLFTTVFIVQNAFAFTIKWKNPYLVGDRFYDASNQLLQNIEDEVNPYLKKQTELGKGMANASAYASTAANFDGYHGYDLFGIMLGVTMGAQFPASEVSKVLEIKDTIVDKKDVYAGVGVGGAVNVGLNGGRFKVKLLDRPIYFNIKFFYYDLTYTDYSVQFCTFGIGANWQWIKPKVLGNKYLFKWRGISVGAGLNYNRQKMDLHFNLLQDFFVYADGDGDGTDDSKMSLIPGFDIGFQTDTVTIPIELHTGLQLLWFLNLNAGIGIDFNIGSSDIIIRNRNRLLVTSEIDGSVIDNTNSLILDHSTTDTFGRVVDGKLMIGVGINIGPMVLTNVEFTYFILHGAAVGISLGFVW